MRRKLRPKRLHFHGPYRLQNWPFKYSFINYITNNPSNRKAWQKLIQCCKYFFAKNPIIVAGRLDFERGWEVSTNTSAVRLQKYIPPNIVSYKLWIAETLSTMSYNDPNCVSSIIPQIYRCDATTLLLHGQILSYNEFLFLSRNVEFLHLSFSGIHDNGTVVKNEDGTIVTLEKLVKTLVKLKQISGSSNPSRSCITSNTVKELLEIPHFLRLYQFDFIGLPEVFDIDTFFIYLKYTKFRLGFAGSISEVSKIRLEKIVDEILQTKYHDYKPPYISFNGLAQEKIRKINYLYERFSGL
uniref:Uncharacterized protein n=1 Tax=Panagrolaimus sp. PS1159 TaxID=55785 RepID=A0AC35FQA0_9BILA